MKAIETYVLPCSVTQPRRVVAKDMDNNRVIILYPGGVQEYPHRQAALALCAKMKWDGAIVGGATKRGWTFVFLGPRVEA